MAPGGNFHHKIHVFPHGDLDFHPGKKAANGIHKDCFLGQEHLQTNPGPSTVCSWIGSHRNLVSLLGTDIIRVPSTT